MGATRVDLDELSTGEVIGLLLGAEQRVVPAVATQTARIAAAAELCAGALRAGGRLVFAGAGTSGRIAVAEAAELPGTFGLDRARVLARVAGGTDSTDHDEDDLSGAVRDIAGIGFTDADVLIAVAASGSTPYTLELARAARAAGASVVAVVTTTGSPLAAGAAIAIEAVVGTEVLRGSTRLTAGTAQKVVLNALTTAAMVRSGRVHGDLMIDVEPANAKLRDRAAGIVAEVAGCDPATALAALAACDDSARAAVLHLVRGWSPDEAKARAARHETLRSALGA